MQYLFEARTRAAKSETVFHRAAVSAMLCVMAAMAFVFAAGAAYGAGAFGLARVLEGILGVLVVGFTVAVITTIVALIRLEGAEKVLARR